MGPADGRLSSLTATAMVARHSIATAAPIPHSSRCSIKWLRNAGKAFRSALALFVTVPRIPVRQRHFCTIRVAISGHCQFIDFLGTLAGASGGMRGARNSWASRKRSRSDRLGMGLGEEAFLFNDRTL